MTERVIVANSIPLDGDGNPYLTVTGTLETGSVSTDPGVVVLVPADDTGVELAAADDTRYGLSIQNTSTADLFVLFGEDAALDLYSIRLPQWAYVERDIYRGVVTGIWDTGAADGGAMVTTMTTPEA